MSTAPILAPSSRVEDHDQRVILGGIDWWQFETFLAIRGDRAGVRVTYSAATRTSRSLRALSSRVSRRLSFASFSIAPRRPRRCGRWGRR